MSQAEELLFSLTETVPVHTHPVPDSDTYFLIDPYTRQIENTNYQKTVLMRGDHNSERFTFELPRYVDGHDMSLCNRVIVHFDNVGDSIENVHSDVAYTDDLRLNPDNPETVICSWLIRREATQIVGILSFSLQYLCVEDGEITYEWNTDSYDDIEIRKSKQNGEAAVVNYTNVLEQWRSQIFGAGDSVMSNITTEGANQVAAVKNESATQQAAIELKGSETLATIPEDYTEVYNMAEEALRTKADSVICEAEGTVIAVADASDDHIRGLNVYGKSSQLTTTGKNLLPTTLTASVTRNGVTFIPKFGPDGELLYIDAYGTATDLAYITVITTINLPEGEYILSGCPAGGGVSTYDVRFNGINARDYGDGVRFTITADSVQNSVTCVVNSGVWVNGIRFYPMIRLASIEDASFEPCTGGVMTPSPESPRTIVSVENPAIDIHGKNLIPYPYINESIVSNGITFTVNSDGSVTANGTSTGTAYFPLQSISSYDDVYPIPRGEYVLSGVPIEYCRIAIGIWKGRKRISAESAYCNKPYNLVVSDDGVRFDIVCTVDAGVTLNNAVFRPQLEVGNTPTTYEPYVNQTLTLNHTLHGIPVTSVGNYTDENGQQWICDEVDLERGVYVQRIYKYVVTGAEPWTTSLQQPSTDGHTRFDCGIRGEPAPLINDALCTHAPWGGNTNPKTGIAAWVNNPGVDMLQIRFLTWQSTVEELTEYFAAQYEAGMPVTYHYIIATPIETPLTAEEIEAYKSIKTNYPNTTIFNDAGAMMKVKYNADTKLYISNTVETEVANVVEGVLNDTY